MATRFLGATQWGAASDVMFRLAAQFFEDTLVTTGGWVVTADAGQTLPSALVAPTAINQPRGYRIYKMNDALQATFPIVMRVDYASSSNAPNAFGVYLTFGTGSNGSGTITGVALANLQVAQPQTTASFPMNNYASAAPNRFCFGCGVNNSSFTYFFVLTLERSKDASGNDSGDGLILVYGPAGSGNNYNQLSLSKYIIMAGGVQPNEERGLSYVLSVNNPSQVFAPGDVGVGIVIPMKGVAQQPGMNVLVTNTGDVSVEGFLDTIIYGASRHYQQLNLAAAAKRLVGSAGPASDNNSRILMRYD
jgi:hypothetical protein